MIMLLYTLYVNVLQHNALTTIVYAVKISFLGLTGLLIFYLKHLNYIVNGDRKWSE